MTQWVIRYNTGGYGNGYKTRKEAQEYADGANRYSQQKQGEYIVREIVRLVNGVEVASFSAHD